MQGKVEMLSVELKNVYEDPNLGDGGNSLLEQHSASVYVDELREHSVQQSAQPLRTAIRRSAIEEDTDDEIGKASINTSEVTTWKSTNDLSRENYDTYSLLQTVEFKESSQELMTPQSNYKIYNNKSQQSLNKRASEHGSYGSLASDKKMPKSKLRFPFFGSRKSLTLNSSKVAMNDGLSEDYRVINDDDYDGSYNESALKTATSTPTLRDDHKKRRFSLGKFRKSKGSDPDVRLSGKKLKNKTSEKKSTDGAETPKSKRFHFKLPFKRHSKALDPLPDVEGSNLLTDLQQLNVTHNTKHVNLNKPAPELASHFYNTDVIPEYDMSSLTGVKIAAIYSQWTPINGRRVELDHVEQTAEENVVNHKQMGSKFNVSTTDVAARLNAQNNNDTSLTDEMMKTFNPSPDTNFSDMKPKKLKGSPAEIAAHLYSNQRMINSMVGDCSLTGIVDRPHFDIDQVPKKIDTLNAAYGPESEGSDVHSDDDVYLQVGKSDFYFERQKSLLYHKSSSTRRRERNNYVNQEEGSFSDLSSISSLNSTDKVVCVGPKVERTMKEREEINDWLANTELNNEEPQMNATYKQTVYCAPTASNEVINPHQDVRKKEFTIELQKQSKVSIPLDLAIGRLTTLYGQLMKYSSKASSGLIRINFTSLPTNDDIYLKLTSEGDISVEKNAQCEVVNGGLECPSAVAFKLKIVIECNAIAITMNDYSTVHLPKSITGGSLNQFELLQCDNIILEELVISRNMVIPLTLKTNNPCIFNIYLNMLVILTADSQRISVCFTHDDDLEGAFGNSILYLLIDFVNNQIVIENFNAPEQNRIMRYGVDYVPEQIKQIEFSLRKFSQHDQLTIKLNEKMCTYEIDLGCDIRFDHVKVKLDGDMKLLDAVLKSDN